MYFVLNCKNLLCIGYELCLIRIAIVDFSCGLWILSLLCNYVCH